ncbi:MAG: 2'-5' RNA ligase family protein [Candidatus Zixiibacteriota bacterium]
MMLLAISYPRIGINEFSLIQDIRKKHDMESYELVEPHFTFIFPVTGIDKDIFIRHISITASLTEKIKFTLHHAIAIYGEYDKKWYTFLIPQNGFDMMALLHHRLYTGVLIGKGEFNKPYIPHITVGCFEREENCRALVSTINEQKWEIKGELIELTVLSKSENTISELGRIKLLSK